MREGKWTIYVDGKELMKVHERDLSGIIDDVLIENELDYWEEDTEARELHFVTTEGSNGCNGCDGCQGGDFNCMH